jgi:hypothetical protein
MSKSFVPAIRGNRKQKIYVDDLAKLYKIAKRKTPSIPSFYEKHRKIQETDVDSETCEGQAL